LPGGVKDYGNGKRKDRVAALRVAPGHFAIRRIF